MKSCDLQIGYVETHPEHRGRGLATAAIQSIVPLFKSGGRRFWYVVADENAASIRAVTKAGFLWVGKGVKLNRSQSLIGKYVILREVHPHEVAGGEIAGGSTACGTGPS